MTPCSRAVLVGAAAGVIATVPMTMVMLAWHRRLPLRQRYPLPPRLITDRAAAMVPLPEALVPPPGAGRALAAHFAFGAAAGSVYSGVRASRSPHPVSAGVGYGLLVWAASYLGWVPAAGLMPPATRQPRGRNAMMIAAHIVWGATLGLAARQLEERWWPATQRRAG